jgi:pimeloyl-ACP methyl ester carboxylesterase
MPEAAYLDRTGDMHIAYRQRAGGPPTILFLPGYASDMDGAKALALDEFAAARGLGIVRFDYSGTGLSDGQFEDGTLARWMDDALAVVDLLTDGPLILVGSSMGGWIALHVALRRPGRVQAIVGIAAAPDFTEWGYSDEEKAAIAAVGRLEQPNPYGGEPQVTTRGFWESGQQLRVLNDQIAIDCPVRLVHGDCDEEVPMEVPTRLMAALRSADVQISLVKGGGHRLSEPHQIATILRTVAGLLETP